MSRPKLSTILICVGLFFFFLILFFPYQNLRGFVFGKIYANTQILIVAEDLSPSFFGWPGVKLKKVSVTIPMGDADMDLASQSMTVRAGLGGLLPPAPMISLAMDGLQKGGDLYVRLSQSSSQIKAVLDAEKVNLEQILIPGLSDPIVGEVTTDGDIVYDKNELSKTTGQFSLDIAKLKIPPQNIQGFVIPGMPLGAAKAKINIRNGTVEFTTFQFGSPNGDIRGNLTGDIRLGKDLMSSYLNIVLRIQLSDKYRVDPQSATLVSLLQTFQSTAPGDYAMKWAATFQEMSTNIGAAIPQKPTN